MAITLLGITTLLEVANFSKETSSLGLTALLVLIDFLTGVAYIEDASTGNTCIGDNSIRVISIEVAISISIRGTGVRCTDWDVILTRPSLSDDKDADIEVAFVTIAYIRSVYIVSNFVGSSSTIKYLKIFLQSFEILRVKLFGTWLEIGVGSCWLWLCLF